MMERTIKPKIVIKQRATLTFRRTSKILLALRDIFDLLQNNKKAQIDLENSRSFSEWIRLRVCASYKFKSQEQQLNEQLARDIKRMEEDEAHAFAADERRAARD